MAQKHQVLTPFCVRSAVCCVTSLTITSINKWPLLLKNLQNQLVNNGRPTFAANAAKQSQGCQAQVTLGEQRPNSRCQLLADFFLFFFFFFADFSKVSTTTTPSSVFFLLLCLRFTCFFIETPVPASVSSTWRPPRTAAQARPGSRRSRRRGRRAEVAAQRSPRSDRRAEVTAQMSPCRGHRAEVTVQ